MKRCIIKTMSNQIFIDSSGFKALIDDNDDFFEKAVAMWSKLKDERGIELVTSNYMIDECLTLLRNRCGLEKAMILKSILTQGIPIIKVIRVKMGDEAGAWKWFEKDWSKLSFTDCVTFAQMKRLGIKKYFGFDEHFDRAGFIQY